MIDAETILHKLNIPFDNKGNNQLLAKCPFHDDHNYSLSIKKDPFLYFCFACGAKGNAISLVKHFTDTNPYKFLEIGYTEKIDSTFINSLRMYKIKKENEKIEEKLPEFKIVAYIFEPYENKECKEYCIKRNILEVDTKLFNMFYIEKGFIGIIAFHKRLVIPIKDKEGKIVAYEGRDISGKAEKKCIYPYKSKVGDTIFNNHKLDRTKLTIFVEGILDLIVVKRALPDIQVSTFFGIQLSNKQIKIINEFVKIVTMLDPDYAGLIKGNLSLDKIYNRSFDVCILSNNDPNESHTEEIVSAFKNRVSITEFHLKNNNLLQKTATEW